MSTSTKTSRGSTSEPDSNSESCDYSPENQFGYFYEGCACIRRDGHNPNTCIFSTRTWSELELLRLAHAVEEVEPNSTDSNDDCWDDIACRVTLDDGGRAGSAVIRNKMEELIHASSVSNQCCWRSQF